MPSPISIVPADSRLIAQARRRGGEKAAAKIQHLITQRAVRTHLQKEDERKALMADNDFERGLRQFLKAGDNEDGSK